ncbi:uncharacterized protein RJT20DRAFT_126694 [Scheffersomyces xylosifermentans]|uniref:uncharacterized protein n=1 Tax=Scheffersomyces xylosifermentans TaxID=1304137 RepID=UPI00315CAC42
MSLEHDSVSFVTLDLDDLEELDEPFDPFGSFVGNKGASSMCGIWEAASKKTADSDKKQVEEMNKSSSKEGSTLQQSSVLSKYKLGKRKLGNLMLITEEVNTQKDADVEDRKYEGEEKRDSNSDKEEREGESFIGKEHKRKDSNKEVSLQDAGEGEDQREESSHDNKSQQYDPQLSLQLTQLKSSTTQNSSGYFDWFYKLWPLNPKIQFPVRNFFQLGAKRVCETSSILSYEKPFIHDELQKHFQRRAEQRIAFSPFQTARVSIVPKEESPGILNEYTVFQRRKYDNESRGFSNGQYNVKLTSLFDLNNQTATESAKIEDLVFSPRTHRPILRDVPSIQFEKRRTRFKPRPFNLSRRRQKIDKSRSASIFESFYSFSPEVKEQKEEQKEEQFMINSPPTPDKTGVAAEGKSLTTRILQRSPSFPSLKRTRTHVHFSDVDTISILPSTR